MSRRSEMTSGAQSGRVDITAALRDAGFTALAAFGLFLPLIGFLTGVDGSNQLVLTTRWPLLFAVVAAVAACRLLYCFAITPWLARRAQQPVQSASPAWRDVVAHWFVPFGIAFLVVYPVIVFVTVGSGGGQKWIDSFGIQILIYVMLGWGLNIVVGLAGLLDLGYVAFYAVGAYAYALLATTFGLSFWICLPLAGILAAFWGIILGFPVLRLRGDYLAIVTLAFGEMIRLVLINWIPFSGGYAGIASIPKVTFFGLSMRDQPGGFADFFHIDYSPIQNKVFLYYVILCLALITNFVTLRLRRLPIGRAWEALREDEIACRAIGINPTTVKLSAFGTGALLAGFAGAFFATRLGFISPESFTFQESATVIAIVVLGGRGSQLGVVLAAAVL